MTVITCNLVYFTISVIIVQICGTLFWEKPVKDQTLRCRYHTLIVYQSLRCRYHIMRYENGQQPNQGTENRPRPLMGLTNEDSIYLSYKVSLVFRHIQ